MLKLAGTLDIKGKDQIKRVYDPDGIAPTLTTSGGGSREAKIMDEGRIRKLTPQEYFRLMGFTDEDWENCVKAGISDTQLYKQAGNSIVVDVLMAIFKEML